MSAKEYRTAASAQGGLLTVRGAHGIAFGDRVQIRDHRNRRRNGQVIRAALNEVLVQVFEGTEDIDLESTWVRFLDQPLEITLSPEILGRIFNGLGEPKDGRPPIVSGVRRSVSAGAINPAARTYPREFIQTGVSTIDGLNSLVARQVDRAIVVDTQSFTTVRGMCRWCRTLVPARVYFHDGKVWQQSLCPERLRLSSHPSSNHTQKVPLAATGHNPPPTRRAIPPCATELLPLPRH